MNGLDLFSGGGFAAESLAPWVRTIAYCEIDRHKQDILLSRMLRGEIDSAPIWDDVTTLRGPQLPRVDIITAGFPCTDVSVAGPKGGLGAERTGLFFHVVRLIKETAPSFVLLENTPGIKRHIPTIRNQIESLGYQCRDGYLSAADVGAPHKRNRWFLLAYSSRLKKKLRQAKEREKDLLNLETLENGQAANTVRAGISNSPECGEAMGRRAQPFSLDLLEGNDWNEYASFLLRMDLGRCNRGHAIRTIGDSVPPAQEKEAFKKLIGIGNS